MTSVWAITSTAAVENKKHMHSKI